MSPQNGFMVPLSQTIDYAFYPRVPMISLELTNNCNLKCPYCANPALTRPKTYIEWPLLEKIVNECAERQFNLAYLHGVGEPLLWERLEEVISLIKRKRAGMGSFATNGTLLNPNRVKRLLDAGLENIYVSIDTLDPEIYKNTRGGKLEKVIRNVQDMIKIVPRTFQITVALMDHKDHRITEQTIAKFHETFGYHDNVRCNPVPNYYFPSAPADYQVEPTKSESCVAPVSYFFIALDGRAAICCMDQDVRHSIGNVAERSIHDVWFDAKTQTTFRNIALGIFACPDVCTKNCRLKTPKQDGTAVAIGYGLPFEEATKFANVLLFNGQSEAAYTVFRALAVRDPTNQQVGSILRQIQLQQAVPQKTFRPEFGLSHRADRIAI